MRSQAADMPISRGSGRLGAGGAVPLARRLRRWRRWGGRLRGRLGRLARAWRPISMVLHRPAAPAHVAERRVGGASVHFAPRIRLAFHSRLVGAAPPDRGRRSRRRPATPARAQRPTVVLRAPVAGRAAVAPAARRSGPLSSWSFLGAAAPPSVSGAEPLGRALMRAPRPLLAPRARPDRRSRGRLESWSMRVVRATRRREERAPTSGRSSRPRLVVAAAAAPRQAPPAEPSVPSRTGSWPEVRRHPVAAVPPAEPIDVAALTDQVMHRIDRRLVAWRERTGRL